MGEEFYPPLHSAKNNLTSRYINIASSPAYDVQPLPKFFWMSIASAQSKIYVTSSYVVPDNHIREALIARAHAGVDVRLLSPNNHTDAKPIRLAAHHYYEDFLEAGVKIYEYQPTMIHTKFLMVDDKWSVIGSANMDLRSVLLNEENVLGILNPAFALELNAMFKEDLQQAKQITLEEWKKRGLLQRMGESLFVRFAKQY